MSPIKSVFLDTDIGDDIDDALALAMLLNSPEVDLLGISTVHGEVETRSRIAAAMLEEWNRRQIPVCNGFGQPYNKNPRTGFVQYQGRILRGRLEFESIIRQPLIRFMSQRIKSAGRPVILLGIGPLTNIARLIQADPAISGCLSEIVLMGAGINRIEWNFEMDPEAADIVMRAGLPVRLIPVNITEKSVMDRDVLHALRDSEHSAHNMLYELVCHWQEIHNSDLPILHDPLAVGAILRPDLFQFQPMAINVNLDPAVNARGYSSAKSDPRSSIQACVLCDYEGFSGLYRNITLAPPRTDAALRAPRKKPVAT
ncbi:MAG: nucleoside hydrolase [bacterium]